MRYNIAAGHDDSHHLGFGTNRNILLCRCDGPSCNQFRLALAQALPGTGSKSVEDLRNQADETYAEYERHRGRLLPKVAPKYFQARCSQ